MDVEATEEAGTDLITFKVDSTVIVFEFAADGGVTGSLRNVNDWAYWLQDIDLVALGQSAFDLVVIDYSRDGSEAEEFPAPSIQSLKEAGDGRIVLAYMSIGEAEEGRFYFDPAWVDPETKTIQPGAPSFLATSNPDFPDNYKVRFWDPVWQQIIITNPGGHSLIGDARSYLDRIIDAGFSGVYLDIIDAFEFFGPEGEMPERPTAAADMIAFVLAISTHARETRGISNFLVFPQNGPAILEAEGGDKYLATVDGIGAEDTFYFGELDNDNELEPAHTAEVTPFLDRFVAAGKQVLAIDYVQEPAKVADFYERARQRLYTPYASIRDLDRLVINPGFEPD
jgi:cysteinyl-tRNA synthetase